MIRNRSISSEPKLNLFSWDSKEHFTKEVISYEIRKYKRIIKSLLKKIKETKGLHKQQYYINRYKEYKHYLNNLNEIK